MNELNNAQDALKFSVFFSYNSKDKGIAIELAKALRDRGLSVWLDLDKPEFDTYVTEKLEKGLRTSKSFAVLISNHGLGHWQTEEVQAALHLAVTNKLPIIGVILPETTKIPDLPIFLEMRDKVDLRPTISEDGLNRLLSGINSLNLCSSITSPKLQRQTRHLRRRCRVITRGTKHFQTILYHLLSRQVEREEAVKAFHDSWESLKKPYERMMAQAAYLEVIGDIESMQEILEKHKFTGSTENSRKLYQAISYEKLDDVKQAQKLLRTVLDTEETKVLLTAAQFNMHVCYEKTSDFENTDFEAFFKFKKIDFVDGERLIDKAVAMHMIKCMRLDRPFIYKDLMRQSLSFLSKNSYTGYSKSLLTHVMCEKSLLTENEVGAILDSIKNMDTNSYTAIMISLYNHLPSEAEHLKKIILEKIYLTSCKSETVIKWMRAHGYHPKI